MSSNGKKSNTGLIFLIMFAVFIGIVIGIFISTCHNDEDQEITSEFEFELALGQCSTITVSGTDKPYINDHLNCDENAGDGRLVFTFDDYTALDMMDFDFKDPFIHVFYDDTMITYKIKALIPYRIFSIRDTEESYTEIIFTYQEPGVVYYNLPTE